MTTKIALVGPAGYQNHNVIRQLAAFNGGREGEVEVTFLAIGDSTYGHRYDIIIVVPGVLMTHHDRQWLSANLHTRLGLGGLLIGM